MVQEEKRQRVNTEKARTPGAKQASKLPEPSRERMYVEDKERDSVQRASKVNAKAIINNDDADGGQSV